MTDFRLAGVDVPRIGLGTNRLTTVRQHVTFVREAVAAGVRHIDTAQLYSGGDSERAIGDALDGSSEDVLVATKGGYGGAGQGRPEVLRAQIEQSLRSLRGVGCPRVAAAAERLGVTENTVKLAWLLRRSPVVLPIPGTLSIEHLRHNLEALELQLDLHDDIAA
jgi:aryl-alcohol dehydrogenase-like predicted oxidoreductase